jgi:hypothetical protein
MRVEWTPQQGFWFKAEIPQMRMIDGYPARWPESITSIQHPGIPLRLVNIFSTNAVMYQGVDVSHYRDEKPGDADDAIIVSVGKDEEGRLYFVGSHAHPMTYDTAQEYLDWVAALDHGYITYHSLKDDEDDSSE